MPRKNAHLLTMLPTSSTLSFWGKGLLAGMLLPLGIWFTGCEEEEEPLPTPMVQEVEAERFFADLISAPRTLNISTNTQSQPELLGLNARLHIPANAFLHADGNRLHPKEGVQIELMTLHSPLDFLLDSGIHRFHDDRYQDPFLEIHFSAHTHEGAPLKLVREKHLMLEYNPVPDDIAHTGMAELADTACQDCYFYPRLNTSLAATNGMPAFFLEMQKLDSMGLGIVRHARQGRIQSHITLEHAPQEGEAYVMVFFKDSHASFWGKPDGTDSFILDHLYPGVPFTVYGLSFYRDKVFVGRLDTVLNQAGTELRLPVFADEADNVRQEIQQLHN